LLQATKPNITKHVHAEQLLADMLEMTDNLLQCSAAPGPGVQRQPYCTTAFTKDGSLVVLSS
jgi:hypothetical protein